MPTVFLNRLSRRGRRLLCWVAGLLLAYTSFGFLILPQIVRAVAVKQLSKELNREVTIAAVRLNPYALSGAIRGLRVKDPDGETLLGWDEAYANLQLASFAGPPWVFRDISLSNPIVRVQVNRDYTLNFTDLVERFSKTDSNRPPPKASAAPAALRVDRFRITGARVALADLTPRQPFRRVIGPVEIAMNDFRTDPENHNRHAFTGTTDGGESFSWSGEFSINPLRAEGQFSVTNVTLNKFAPLYQDLVRLEIRDGVAGFGAAYRFIKSETTNELAVTNAFLTLRSFQLAPAGGPENLVELPEFAVSGVSGELLTRSAVVDSVFSRGAVLNLRRAPDASLNLVEAAKPAPNANAPGGILFLLRAATNAFTQLLQSTNTATGLVRDLQVQDAAVRWRDEVPSSPVRLSLDQIALAARNLANFPGTNLTSSLALRWNTNGTLKTEVAATLFPLAATVRLQLDRLELSPLNPYLENLVNVFVLGSKLSLDGAVQIQSGAEDLPAATFKGSTRLDDFSTVDGVMAEDLLKWGSLQLDGIDANLNPPSLAVARVRLADGLARIAVETNHTLNVLAAFKPARPNEAPAAAAPAPAPPAAARGGKSSARKAFAQLKHLLNNQTNGLTAQGLPALSVATIEITNTQFQFTDRSVTPALRTSLQQIQGSLKDLSSDELRNAQVQLSGRVDNTGPVEITGSFHPLSLQQTSTVRMVVKDMALNPGDPYCAKFLGYHLAKGQLNVEVTYEMNARHLKGQNRVLLDQFTLGDRVESPEATKLPVRLGIALLKDRAGKIELNVPIEGNLDDPKFRLGPVIWHVILNVFTKAITSPFALLGSMFGGGKGEDLQFQEFAAGRVEPDASQQSKLDALLSALQERPGLQLEIEGSFDPDADATGLRRQKLEQKFRLEKWTALRKTEQTQTPPDQIPFSPDEYNDALKRAFDAMNATQGVVTNEVPGEARSAPVAKSAPRSGEVQKGAARLVKVEPNPSATPAGDMERVVFPTIPVAAEDLAQLAQARAVRVQQAILNSGKVASDRIFLVGANAAGTNHGSRVFFHLR